MNKSIGGGRFPASFGQERLWILEHMTPDVPLYMHALVTRLHGALDVDVLMGALDATVERHEVLRTRFEMDEGVLMQVIEPPRALEVSIIGLEHLDAAKRENEARSLVERLADRTVDISAGPPIAASIVRLAPEDHILVIVVHHIVSDGWSIGVLERDLSAFYRASVERSDPELDPLDIQYADFAVWQRENLSGERLEREVAHWRDRLAGAPALLELPTDRTRPAVQSFDGEGVAFRVAPEVGESLRAIAAGAGATKFMVLLAAFNALLARYTGHSDLPVATPVAGRSRSEVEDLIGFFVNTLVMRVDLGGDPTFSELVERVADVALDAYSHQDLPFEKLVEELNPQRALSHLPIAQVMFVLQNASTGALDLPGVDATRVEPAIDMAPYDLTLEMTETDGGLAGTFIYNVDLFDRATVEQLARHFQRLLAAAAADPGAPLSRVRLLDDDERSTVLSGWYEQRPEFLPGPLVHESIARVAATTPEKIAATFEGESITYRELNDRAGRLAHYLRSQGVGAEDVVGVMFDKSIEMLIAFVGVWKAGAAFVPLDADVPPERCSYMLEATGARIVLTLERLQSRAELLRVGGRPVPRLRLDADRDAYGAFEALDPGGAPGPLGLAYIIFTSGSTGEAKGVMMQHGGLVNMTRFAVEIYGVTPESRFLQFMSITFDAFLSEILPVLTIGATLVIGRRDEVLPGPDLLAFLRDERISNVLLTPSALSLLQPKDLPDLGHLVVCGEACPPELVIKWSGAHRFVNAYGPTEITCFSHAEEMVPDGQIPPIGRPMANTRSYVLDADMEPVPFNVRGELYVGTIGLARGYLDRPDLTAERFLPDPFSSVPGARIYRTGDVVRCRRDGRLEFFGRADSQVKVRGFRVEPGEVEAAVLKHPDVAEAVVLVHDGGGDKRLICYLVPRDGPLDGPALRSWMARRLPGYMVPAVFVPLAAMPLLPSGKIDRQGLPEPPSGRPDVATAYVPPATPTEKEVERVWRGVLGIDRVGSEDKFFDVGGNSLKIVELYESLHGSHPGALSVAELFEHTTVREMAKVIDDRREEQSSPTVAGFEL